MSAAISATDRARFMALALDGPRPFGETKERYCERLARKIAFTARRVRALISNNEHIRLTADEYVVIERAYQDAGESVRRIEELSQEIRSARPELSR